MLVPGLENAALSKMISSDSVSDVHLYTWLCKCGREILAKYAQKQVCDKRQAIKTKATKVLLSKLGDASENSRETILSALKSHAKVLQGYEHLFSAKGNTFALMEQTQGLRENNDQAPASLLRYHDLKNKLLGPDTPLPLTARQKKVISELAEKKSLTLKTFEALEVYPRITARIVIRLHQENLLEPGLCTRVLEHPHSSEAVAAVVKLHQGNLFKPELYTGVLEHQDPFYAAVALVKLHEEKLLKPCLYARVLAHSHPFGAAAALVRLHQENLIKSRQAQVLGHKNPDSAARAFLKLNRAGLLKADLCARVLEHPHPSVAAVFLVKLHQGNMLESKLCARVPEHKKPDSAIMSPDLDSIRESAAVIVAHSPSETVKVESLYRLLAIKMADAIKGFCMAIQNNHPDVIAAFIEKSAMIIAALSLEEEQKSELLYRLLADKDINDLPIFFMALQYGYSEAITAFIQASVTAINALSLSEAEKVKLLYDLLASKRGDGTPGFFKALHRGHSGAITAFVQASVAAIDGLSLSEAQKVKLLYDLLASKAVDNTPGFYMALQNGHSGAITTFIQESTAAINRVIPTDAKKAKLLCELLASKDTDGRPGFFMTLYNGHTDAITAFIQESAVALARLFLPEAEKAKLLCELLASKSGNGTPGLYMALQEGNTDAITAFIEESVVIITRLSLSKAEKIKWLCELLTSRRGDGIPGFLIALQKGHTDAITAFIQSSAAVIVRLTLPDAEKAKLLCKLLTSKNADGLPGFYMALRQGHAKAITAFIQASATAIVKLIQPEAEKAKLLRELLTSKNANGIPGFYVALYNGHFEAVTAFIRGSATAIVKLILPEAEKAKLLCELLASKKRAKDVPGFYAALHQGHTRTITAFIQASAAVITSFFLSKAEKAKLLYDLLASKAVDSTPGFYTALKNGHTEVVTSFIRESAAVITSFSLSQEERAKLLCELLASKKADGTPGFYMALKNGHTGAVIAFIQASVAAMTALSESEEERAELIYGLFDKIKSENKDKFLLSLELGGPAVRKAFTEGVDQLPLSAEQKRNLKILDA